MISVGVTELRRRATALLRLVELGETIEITSRGRAVALLRPTPAGGPYERMLAAGEISPATASIGDLPPPLPWTGAEFPSVILSRLRGD
jgi:antitoxin (DNA-binding transcriptional repressor) of toxin-antitoxin stability system